MSGVIKEWECQRHGCFESTHPICPEIGCESEAIKRVFLTPPLVSDGTLKRFNAGIKKSVDMMGLGNLRSARAGEAAYGNSGNGMLWGDDVKKVLGVDMAALTQAAAKPMKVTYRDGHEETLNKSVMRELGAEGMTKRVLPRPAETTGSVADRPRKAHK
jgi:hypothetical protein